MVKITHFVHSSISNCTIATAREQDTQRIKIFLIKSGKIYRRNGINGVWNEITENIHKARQIVHEALQDNSIPCYTTSSVVN